MTEQWVPQAIAEQEEYVRRWKSCGEVPGKAHRYQTFRGPNTTLPVPDEVTWQQCINCDVTETKDDYQRKMLAQGN